MTKDRIRSQRGITLMTVALLLVAFMGIAALCIDMGILYTARTSAQHAADAAALAGAYTFVNTPNATQPTAAQNAAVAVAGANKILGQPVTITPDNVDVVGRHVTVTVSRTGTGGIATVFAKAIGIRNADVTVKAYAQASNSASASRCIKPIYMPNTVLAPSNETPNQACNNGHVLFDSNNNLTAWAQAQMGNCALIRPTSPSDVTKGGFSAGQFFSLDFGSGANTYRCTWSQCLNNVTCQADQSLIACGNKYPVKTGDMVGPTNQGVGDAIGPNPDTFLGIGQYESSTGVVSDTSRSLALVPVWNNCVQTINSGTAGQQAQVIGFLSMFLDGMANQNGCNAKGGGGGNGNGGGNWVKVNSIDAMGCGNAGGGGGAGPVPTGPFAIPVQLVKQ